MREMTGSRAKAGLQKTWQSPRVLLVLVASLLVLSGCSGAPGSMATTVTTTATAGTAPTSCDEPTGLFPALTIDRTGSCASWIDSSMGRAIRGTTGSASVWSRRTEAGTALVVGAIHTLGQGWFGPEGTDVSAAISDPGGQIGVPRLFLMLPDGSGTDTLASPWFGLYHPSIAAERNGNLMGDVLPLEDFYVAVTDPQKLDVELLAPVPDPIIHAPVPLYDPSGSTLADATYAAAADGELVLMLGFPNETGALSAAVGRVLDNAEAASAVDRLADVGDPEGSIPYDAAVEMIIEGSAAAGMSGGPVVDRDGRLIGVLVRASDEHDGVQYVRAVRMTYIAEELGLAFEALSEAERDAVSVYLEK